MSLKEIIEHGMKHNNRTRQACIRLNWLSKEGNLLDAVPEFITNEFKSQQKPGFN